MIQQRPHMSREELVNSITLALVENIPGNRNGPDMTQLMKANTASQKIMSLVDQYLSDRGVN